MKCLSRAETNVDEWGHHSFFVRRDGKRTGPSTRDAHVVMSKKRKTESSEADVAHAEAEAEEEESKYAKRMRKEARRARKAAAEHDENNNANCGVLATEMTQGKHAHLSIADAHVTHAFQRGDAAAASTAASAAPSTSPSRRVRIGGLSRLTTVESIVALIGGGVATSAVRLLPGGGNAAVAVVTMPDAAAAAHAVTTLHDTKLDGRFLTVMLYEAAAAAAPAPAPSALHQMNTHTTNAAAMPTMHPPKSEGVSLDWVCVACGANNFTRRTSCFRCAAAKRPEAGGGAVAGVAHDVHQYQSAARCAPLDGGDGGRSGVVSVSGDGYEVYVKYLSHAASDAAVRDYFERCGELLGDVRVLRDATTGESKGAGFVTFVSEVRHRTDIRPRL